MTDLFVQREWLCCHQTLYLRVPFSIILPETRSPDLEGDRNPTKMRSVFVVFRTRPLNLAQPQRVGKRVVESSGAKTSVFSLQGYTKNHSNVVLGRIGC